MSYLYDLLRDQESILKANLEEITADLKGSRTRVTNLEEHFAATLEALEEIQEELDARG